MSVFQIDRKPISTVCYVYCHQDDATKQLIDNFRVSCTQLSANIEMKLPGHKMYASSTQQVDQSIYSWHLVIPLNRDRDHPQLMR